MTDEQKKQFESLSCQLSPENLCCDGELSREESDERYREIMKEWRQLERECGQHVTEDDVWSWVYTRMRGA